MVISKLITAPALEPITTAEAKSHMRVTVSDDDTYIAGLITAAREHIENTLLNRALITQTREAYFDNWPSEFILPFPTLQTVTSIKYKNELGVETTVTATDYIADIERIPGRIVLAYNKSWPSSTLYPVNPITVRYVCGYGLAATTVPEPIRQAMKILVAHLYEAREMYIVGSTIAEVPVSVMALLASYKAYGT